jgi:ribosomal protein S18 acetylase RimI-like enzyme
VDIRTARPDDLDAVVDLWAREGGPTTMPCGPDEAARLLRRDPDALLVAYDDGTLVGTLIVGWDGWRCHFYRLVVEPAWRRQGIAARLVVEGTRRARAFGAGKVEALIALANAPAIEFWARQDLVRDDETGRWMLQL